MKLYLVRYYPEMYCQTYEIVSVVAKCKADVVRWVKRHRLIRPYILEVKDKDTIEWYRSGRLEAQFILNYV